MTDQSEQVQPAEQSHGIPIAAGAERELTDAERAEIADVKAAGAALCGRLLARSEETDLANSGVPLPHETALRDSDDKPVNVAHESITLAAPRPATVRHMPDAITEAERDAFLIFLSQRGVWNQAAYAVGRSGSSFRRLATLDPCFAIEVSEAAQAYREVIQGEIFRRGVIGWMEPICGKDSVITHVRRHSDRLLELEAKAAWPQRYRDNQPAADETAPRGGVLVVPGKLETGKWGEVAKRALEHNTKPDLPTVTVKPD